MASTAARPIPGFVPRRGDGRILGLNIFGISKTEVPASDPDARIDFQFVDAGFDLSVLPFRLPYPVPFRLLGDEVKGWIEVSDMESGWISVVTSPLRRSALSTRHAPTHIQRINQSIHPHHPVDNTQVTYLSPRLRISRGNKGTIFVLEKEE